MSFHGHFDNVLSQYKLFVFHYFLWMRDLAFKDRANYSEDRECRVYYANHLSLVSSKANIRKKLKHLFQTDTPYTDYWVQALPHCWASHFACCWRKGWQTSDWDLNMPCNGQTIYKDNGNTLTASFMAQHISKTMNWWRVSTRLTTRHQGPIQLSGSGGVPDNNWFTPHKIIKHCLNFCNTHGPWAITEFH